MWEWCKMPKEVKELGGGSPHWYCVHCGAIYYTKQEAIKCYDSHPEDGQGT